MKSERLLRAIGEIDDVFIQQADTARRKSHSQLWIKVCAAAACFAVIFTVGIFAYKAHTEEKLPMLTIGDSVREGSMGYEGYFAHSADELVDGNPWTPESDISSLPVYGNPLFRYTEDLIVTEPDTDRMKKELVDAAGRLGMDLNNNSVKETVSQGVVESVYIQDENYRVEANAWHRINIEFLQRNTLPDGYSLGENENYSVLYKTAKYLLEHYAELINMDEPRMDIYFGEYDVYGRRLWNVSFYEGGGDDAQKVINYSFKRIDFCGGEAGELNSVSYGFGGADDVIGVYPIITSDEAMRLLCEGVYVTSVPGSFPGKDAVKKVELIYRNSTNDEVFMPYYKFYVQVKRNGDMATYGTYYVPAVEGRYIGKR